MTFFFISFFHVSLVAISAVLCIDNLESTLHTLLHQLHHKRNLTSTIHIQYLIRFHFQAQLNCSSLVERWLCEHNYVMCATATNASSFNRMPKSMSSSLGNEINLNDVFILMTALMTCCHHCSLWIKDWQFVSHENNLPMAEFSINFFFSWKRQKIDVKN